MRFFLLTSLFTLVIASCDTSEQWTQRSEAPISTDELKFRPGDRKSCNIIDVTDGLPCANPDDCPVKDVGTCDKTTCKIQYTTGKCVADCSGQTPKPLAACLMRSKACGGSECKDPSPSPGAPNEWKNVQCEKKFCGASRGPCDSVKCTALASNGLCDVKRIDGILWETCHAESAQCYSQSCLVLPKPVVSPSATPK